MAGRSPTHHSLRRDCRSLGVREFLSPFSIRRRHRIWQLPRCQSARIAFRRSHSRLVWKRGWCHRDLHTWQALWGKSVLAADRKIRRPDSRRPHSCAVQEVWIRWSVRQSLSPRRAGNCPTVRWCDQAARIRCHFFDRKRLSRLVWSHHLPRFQGRRQLGSSPAVPRSVRQGRCRLGDRDSIAGGRDLALATTRQA